MKYFSLAACLLVLYLPIVKAQTANPEEIAKGRVVMIRGTLNGEPNVGAGVIAGWETGRIYIFTANHVVRDDFATPAETITVEFRAPKGEFIPALLLNSADGTLDLAMLAVEIKNLPEGFVEGLPALSLGDVTTLQRGDSLYAVGYEGQQPWNILGSSSFAELGINDLNFESSKIDVGASGGGLFTQDWQLVGMVTRTEGTKARALRIDRILELLGQWGYPVESAQAGGTYPCQATAVGNTGAASLVNQVRTLPLSKASLALPVRQNSTVTVMGVRSEGGEVWYRITYSYNDENRSGWLLERYLSLAETCPK
jgi:Trypsin-like peptidase domain